MVIDYYFCTKCTIMITRDAEKLIRKYAKQFRALAIVGPRQSGKTSIAKKIFHTKPYVSLEDPDERLFATEDPRGFLKRYQNGAIIDEAQRVPALFSYLQQIIDTTNKDGLYILTGSNNFLLQENISQTLAGRIGYIDLLPLTIQEIKRFENTAETLADYIFNGCYPEIFDKKRLPAVWYPSYIRTYVERDVKQIRNIDNVLLFNRFIQLCAGRTGQQLHVSALSNECGVDVKTVNAWLGILQSSYVIYLLQPHHKNYNKRIVKTPKLYFYDTGLVCSLLGIRKVGDVTVSPFYGALTENFLLMQLLKMKHNGTNHSQFYYWRDNKGVEIDLIIDDGKKMIPVEIKASQTFNAAFLKHLHYWNEISGNTGGILLYGGEQTFLRSDKVKVVSWIDTDKIKF
jgi:uncharacterized protein